MSACYIYKIETKWPNLVFQINSVTVFDAKIKYKFFKKHYEVYDQISGKLYIVTTIKSKGIFGRNKWIEVYNDQNEIILKFNLVYKYAFYIFSIFNCLRGDNNICLTNTIKRILIFQTEDGLEIEGNYWRFPPIPDDVIYTFVSTVEITNPWHLLMSCFCHKTIIRRNTY